MIKIEKERKIKREYIPVYISSLILILFSILLVLTINYDGEEKIETDSDINNVRNEELAITKTDSKCNQDELNELVSLANKISGTYQLTTKQIPFDAPLEDEFVEGPEEGMMDYKYIEIIIKEIKEGVYVQITNNFNNDIKVIKYTDLDSNGEYRYEAPNMDQIITYTVDIYADKYACAGEILRKVSFDTKIYNIYSGMLACVSYPKYSNCAKLVDEELTFDEFNYGLEKYKKNNKNLENQAVANIINAFHGKNFVTAEDVKKGEINDKKEINKILNKIKENKDLIIISCIIIGIGVLVVVLLVFIRRNRS